MAKELKADNGASESAVKDPKHNLAIRDDLIKKLDADLQPLESELDELNTKVKAKKKEIAQARKQFKADTGMALRDFDDGRRVVDLLESKDEDERDRPNDFIRVVNALSSGPQLNWVEAMEAEANATKH